MKLSLSCLCIFCLVGCAILLPGCCAKQQLPAEAPWMPLLDEDLSAWEPLVFGGDGDVRYEEGSLILDMGGPFTGVKYQGDVDALLGPERQPYEIKLQARRTQGLDFFCGLTFPVGTEGHTTLVLGGWAGSMVGLSSLDGMDAASNKTTQLIRFEQNQWYDVRVRVTAEKIECWLDQEQIIDVVRADYEEFSVRPEVQDSIPLGLCTYQTRGEIRNVEVRRLD